MKPLHVYLQALAHGSHLSSPNTANKTKIDLTTDQLMTLESTIHKRHVAKATGLAKNCYADGNKLGTCGGRYKSYLLDAIQASKKLHIHEVFGNVNDCGALLFAVECLQLLEFIIHKKENNIKVEQLVFTDRGSSETFVYDHHPTCHTSLTVFSYAVATKATHCHTCIIATNTSMMHLLLFLQVNKDSNLHILREVKGVSARTSKACKGKKQWT